MKTIRPSEKQLDNFVNGSFDDKPIVMLNMLKFREQAEYEDGAPDARVRSGQEAYEIYSKAVAPIMWAVGGQVLWAGQANSTLIAPEGEDWDRMFLVRYPSRSALIKMTSSPAYQKVAFHRTAALENSRLFETRKIKLPTLILWVLRKVQRIKALFVKVV
ncbi:MAG: DUF1330 domain-containing protein [Sphingomonadales bacterium]